MWEASLLSEVTLKAGKICVERLTQNPVSLTTSHVALRRNWVLEYGEVMVRWCCV